MRLGILPILISILFFQILAAFLSETLNISNSIMSIIMLASILLVYSGFVFFNKSKINRFQFAILLMILFKFRREEEHNQINDLIFLGLFCTLCLVGFVDQFIIKKDLEPHFLDIRPPKSFLE
jgi:hypothetical protein